MKRGFTLAELLMAVLVISIIMVALAPVITKRAYDNLSVEISGKKGLEIFTNPGTYTFDVPVGINTLYISGSGGGGGGAGATFVERSVSFETSTTWSVPQGVNQLTFTITGSGGGGGAGNGTSTGNTSCENNPTDRGMKPNSSEMTKYPLFLAIRASEDESDLCIFKRNAVDDGVWNYRNFDTSLLNISDGPKTCTQNYCCWYTYGPTYTAGCLNGYSNSYNGCKRAVCTYSGAVSVCTSYGRTTPSGPTYEYRLPTESELKKWSKYLNDYSRNANNNGLQLCTYNYLTTEPINVPQCSAHSNCLGVAYNNRCDPQVVWANNSIGGDWSGTTGLIIGNQASRSGSVRCVRPLKRYKNYSGAGGASGAKLSRTISVLPFDTLKIEIGQGGAAGTYNSMQNNGPASRTGNGAQGSETKITHKRGTTIIGTYYVKGGFGGYGAKTNAHGEAVTNGAGSSQTTPIGTCYANGNSGCSVNSYSGGSGSTDKGGLGGRVDDAGTATSGGIIYTDDARTASQRNTITEANYAKGQNASVSGFGGGGGLTPAWANSTSNFYQGGKGAAGKVDILYKVALPGGGGGAAGVAGMNAANEDLELIYKVKQGSRIVFVVGQGGDGGSEQQNGYDGSNTIIGDSEIIFYGGKGGQTSTDAEKNSLLGGAGGAGAGVKHNNTIINTGENGARGQFKLNNTFQNYGFDGGVGGRTFLGFDGGCAGGIFTSNILTYNCLTGSSANGLEGRGHDPVNNRHGGSGGGGGGVIPNSLELGAGGGGSSGYLRIRWNEAENKD